MTYIAEYYNLNGKTGESRYFLKANTLRGGDWVECQERTRRYEF
jgi:hypothetical protein